MSFKQGFDFQINRGIAEPLRGPARLAFQDLQGVINLILSGRGLQTIEIDGRIGPETVVGLRAATSALGGELPDAVDVLRTAIDADALGIALRKLRIRHRARRPWTFWAYFVSPVAAWTVEQTRKGGFKTFEPTVYR